MITIRFANNEIMRVSHMCRLDHTFNRRIRMAKSDMRARPIYHQNREAIEAHLTIVLTALAISRNIERKTGISIKQFVKLLRPIRSGIVTFNGKELLVEAEVPETTLVVLDRLSSGH